ncbi:MAG: hypothetical protein WAW39_14685 [Prosthecobacter sp.]|uniref:hypothetical protein n=1 Tax=Prosthecobacter sp. TaxID=1965333 RepID=UPI003BAF4F3A
MRWKRQIGAEMQNGKDSQAYNEQGAEIKRDITFHGMQWSDVAVFFGLQIACEVAPSLRLRENGGSPSKLFTE